MEFPYHRVVAAAYGATERVAGGWANGAAAAACAAGVLAAARPSVPTYLDRQSPRLSLITAWAGSCCWEIVFGCCCAAAATAAVVLGTAAKDTVTYDESECSQFASCNWGYRFSYLQKP